MLLNKIDLNKLNTFFVVAETSGISNASKKLLITRSAISQNISALERSIGLKLFHRIGRRLVLTPNGERLYKTFRQYQVNLNETFRSMTGPELTLRGVARIGLFDICSRARYASVVSDFIREYPEVKLELSFLPIPVLKEQLLDRRLDFAITYLPLGDEGGHIRSDRINDDELVLVASRDLQKTPATLKALTELPMIQLDPTGKGLQMWFEAHFGESIPPLRIAATCPSTDLIVALVLRNVGVAVLPRSITDPLVQDGRLKEIRPTPKVLSGTYWLNGLHDFTYSPAASRFREKLLEAKG